MARLTCCTCGADLGFDDSDPYADPDCPECLRRVEAWEERERLLAEEELEATLPFYPSLL